ncbi:MAG: bifunctional (p)ppGpp synthetase/guanosine-3',5'-bis(diphosphate) 3'-pyrophosphohydrolase [Bacteroidetes bacterium]|jgi:GTP diphosphokinase / guanosine-3',5'-bis(diphosphate) 3'-diphosphatase|nr:bifunctional (p)ppGpp synthetase/guanosine-3',5'-bis(diphosphate) 3'-pyrophosphohydrolase [Bacteroidota bacterium]MBT6685310.1 bifunctional (p)ppGpp synthetase/guanosine-3',5'-bis(diphosphate) 3'-pyrophosphohydrolase [Bacteroidota bacterium]MBT7143433.1 bifunctional (p)ppGpp synthetase/guanosine-3',5'-bis(diphosphate) 3'-pyrophosphohydrolase [Bacteroidota bacterium]MBT7491455.1 bifunctional (p)ppGpp synthetase/guanosine-3',5'-bis(diphosphate) 3'-pyrophosphohydrolase [Bacteroidota bacterium]
MNGHTPEERKHILNLYDELIKGSPRIQKPESLRLINKAFKIADEAHLNMRRRSGEPYIFHPLEVAKIVTVQIGLGTKSAVCALLHDVVEDTEYTFQDIEELFGEKISNIIKGLTKLTGVFRNQEIKKAENYKRLLLTMSNDIRVILIKLADRLHNMQTLEFMPEKQKRIASETNFLYIPLAHRLGLYNIKTQLEELTFKYLHPIVYSDLERRVLENSDNSIHRIKEFIKPINDKLHQEKIIFDITARPKSIFSTWEKMQKQGISFHEVYDLLAIRFVFEPKANVSEKALCWIIYSIIAGEYKPKPGRLRDWVSTPKVNGYEALHTTVMGNDGNWIEVQIRSHRMDDIAERGLASHWKYKEPKDEETHIERWIKRIGDFLNNPDSDAGEFLDNVKLNLDFSEIYIFTPQGQIRSMPKSATALDFAFDIHSDIGYHSIVSKINGKLQPLNYVLQSGDQVEILTSKNQNPKFEWLNFVVTTKAISAIKNAFKNERKEDITKGMEMLNGALQNLKLSVNNTNVRKLLNHSKIKNKEELYFKIGRGIVDLSNLDKIVQKKRRNKIIKYWQLQIIRSTAKIVKSTKTDDKTSKTKKTPKKPKLVVENINKSEYTSAKCCKPIPGDKIIGYTKADGSILIHKTKCPNVAAIQARYKELLIKVEWTTQKLDSFLEKISLVGIEKPGLVADLANSITEHLKINIRSVKIDSHDGIFKGFFEVYVHNVNDLNILISHLIRIDGVDSVHRVESAEEL